MSRTTAFAIFFSVIAFFALFLVLPIWETVKVAFTSEKGGVTFQYVWGIFASPIYREGLVNSLIMAVGTTVGCLLLSLPLALLYSKFEFPGRSVLNALMLLPMILPPFVGAIGVRAMLGQAGALNSLLINLGLMDPQQPADWMSEGQMTGIIIMNVLHLFPILYLNVVAALSNLDPAMEEAAANLGCPPQLRFWRITLPLIMPGIFAGGTIVFIWAFTELGVPLIFDFRRVTSVQIFDEIKDLTGNPLPYALVVIVLCFTVALYLLSKLIFERGGVMGGGRATTGKMMKKLPLGWALACSAAFVLCIAVSVIPHVGVLLLSVSTDWYGSVLPEGFTLGHFGEALGHELTLSSIANSLKYASLAVLLDLLLGVGIAYVTVRTRIWGRHLLDAAAMLPLAVPGLVLAFGFLAMSREGKPLEWLMLGENPLLLLVIAYAVRRLPYVVRSASAGFQQISPELEYAAQNLGAPPLRALARVTLPLILPNLIAGALLAFAFAMLEVSDSMILAQQSVHYPITKAIYSLLASLGNGPYIASALGVWAVVFLGITLLGAGLLLGRKLGALFRA